MREADSGALPLDSGISTRIGTWITASAKGTTHRWESQADQRLVSASSFLLPGFPAQPLKLAWHRRGLERPQDMCNGLTASTYQLGRHQFCSTRHERRCMAER